jgi:FdhE protein
LDQAKRERPSLAVPAALLADLLPWLCEHPTRLVPPQLSSEQARAKLGGGIPVLRGESVPFDAPGLRRDWANVCAAIIYHQESDAAHHAAAAVCSGGLRVEELATAALAGRAEEVHARAADLGLDAGVVATVLRFTLFPYLVALNNALAPVAPGAAWNRGYCPTCGGWPLLGEFRGLEQDRWLRCGPCAAGWEFPRLACPFCDNRDHHRLGHLHVEGEEARRRAATCEECRGYVKMAATLGPLSPPRLLVADLATLHLDLAAAERGYAVPS